MSRYRPPNPPSTPYITRAGYNALLAEQKQLWSKRREVVAALSEAAAEGDRSENAEYIYRKKELRELDRRIRYLQKRLPGLTVIDRVPAETNRVFFAASVTLCDEQGCERTVRIVGPDELDRAPTHISIDSPLARALLKQALDAEIQVQTPEGMRWFTIVAIDYQAG